MDLNYLYARHQLSLMIADATENPEARRAHLRLAAGYASHIRDFQAGLGLCPATGDAL